MNESGDIRELLRILDVEILREEGRELRCKCVWCSGDHLRINVETGAYQCKSGGCAQKGRRAWYIALQVRGDDKRRAIEDMQAAGLFQKRERTAADGAGEGGHAPAYDPIAEMARAKGCNSAALEAYGAEASVYPSKVDGKTIKEPVARFPTYAPDGSVSCYFYVGVRAREKELQKGKNQSSRTRKGPTGLFLPNGTLPHEGDRWIVVEGVKDAARAFEMGYKAAGTPGGMIPASHAILFRGVDVVLIPDRDAGGDKASQSNGRLLYGIAASIRMVTLTMEWRPKDGFDLRDAIRKHGEGPIRALIESAPLWEPSEKDEQGRRKIVVSRDGTNADQLDVTLKSIEALLAQNDPPTLFARDVQIVALVRRTGKDNIERVVLDGINEVKLEARLQRSALYVVDRGSDGENPVPAPRHVTRTIIGGEGLDRWPPIAGVAHGPILRQSGTILSRPGYDSETRWYRINDGVTVDELEHPTHEDAKLAYSTLMGPFEEFLFDSDASWWNFFAYLMTPFLRVYIDGVVPIFILDAAEPGAGKTTLVDAASQIFAGCATRRLTMRRDEELEPQLSAQLGAAIPLVTIDNIRGLFASQSLEKLLTSLHWSGRPYLSNTSIVEFPNHTTWSASSNNIELGSEMQRRAVLIRIERWPNDRKFQIKHLGPYLIQHRSQLCSAALTIGRAWIAAGSPGLDRAPILVSFERWSEVLGGIASWLGGEILGNRERLAAGNDFEQVEWRGFFLALLAADPQIGADGLTASEIVRTLERERDLVETIPTELADLWGKSGFSRRLGRLLAKRTERRHGPDGLRVEVAGEDRVLCVKRWAVRTGQPVHQVQDRFTSRREPGAQGVESEGLESQNRFTGSPCGDIRARDRCGLTGEVEGEEHATHARELPQSEPVNLSKPAKPSGARAEEPGSPSAESSGCDPGDCGEPGTSRDHSADRAAKIAKLVEKTVRRAEGGGA
jgi:hypothetical protein